MHSKNEKAKKSITTTDVVVWNDHLLTDVIKIWLGRRFLNGTVTPLDNDEITNIKEILHSDSPAATIEYMEYVKKLDDELDVSSFGGKAKNLSVLIRNNLPVPPGLAISIQAFNKSGKLLRSAIDSANNALDQNKLYAVRSSALSEDSEGASWAGQFESFLNVAPNDVIQKIEDCHNSAKKRARAYANKQEIAGDFQVAVVVQEMIQPEYAGVLFTQDPITGKKQLITEYVVGLGESLVSGEADPVRIALDKNTDAPFDATELAKLANVAEEVFGSPQDIEWAWADNTIWLVQARPITTSVTSKQRYDLGEPDELFYWGPSRATVQYMGDFMSGVEKLFLEFARDSSLPTPPKTLVLFYDGKMVWLNNAKEFVEFTSETFEAYAKRNQLDRDIASWKQSTEKLNNLKDEDFADELVNAWYLTEFAEFALYGAESFISKQLERFDDRLLPEIWGTFTTSDEPSFLTALDVELAESGSSVHMANKYPWIRDGYAGPNDEAKWYFDERLKAIKRDGLLAMQNNEVERDSLAKELSLTKNEIDNLTLARRLAEFMDDRKAWMMQSRRLIKKSVSNIEYGWFFVNGEATLVDKRASKDLWKRYIDFKSSKSSVVGTVANSGGRHFISGEVAVLNSHVDPVENDKILVVPSTSPGWVPLMRNARALVTDHGGMMSHAAIVAREFNLPCIVSTKNGTKQLKTGDKVVLNLATGEIIK